MKPEFNLTDIVFLITDPEQLERIVTCIKQTPLGYSYSLSQGTMESEHYACEISKEKNIIKTLH